MAWAFFAAFFDDLVRALVWRAVGWMVGLVA